MTELLKDTEKNELEFWFEYASPYSYISALRLDSLQKKYRFKVVWKPFLLGPIFKEQGWETTPFLIYPAKGKYMWDDVSRLCIDYGIQFLRPAQFPLNSLLAARITLASENQDWCEKFILNVFKRAFTQEEDISKVEVMEAALGDLGLEPSEWIEKALSTDNKLALRAQTALAQEKGVFGAPSFFVKDELFWGDDRLNQACRRFESFEKDD